MTWDSLGLESQAIISSNGNVLDHRVEYDSAGRMTLEDLDSGNNGPSTATPHT